MNRFRLSPAGSRLRHSLLIRANIPADRILLSEWISTDWQSLTFCGERHRAGFVFAGDDAGNEVRRWTDGLSDAEFDLGPSHFLAEIAVLGEPQLRSDGSVLVEIEALTVAD